MTDKQRLDLLEQFGTGILEKKHSTARGHHWPWTIKFSNHEKTPEFETLREAIDYLGEKHPYLIGRKVEL